MPQPHLIALPVAAWRSSGPRRCSSTPRRCAGTQSASRCP